MGGDVMDRSLSGRLERERIAELVSKPREEVEADLKQLFERHVAESVKHGELGFQVYIAIGNAVIHYVSIKDFVTSFNELSQKFRSLGKEVAFLTREYQDRGIIDEEGSWLGLKTTEYDSIEKRVRDIFKPVPHLSQMTPIKDCSPDELMKLYLDYTSGKAEFFARTYKYGTTLDLKGKLDQNP